MIKRRNRQTQTGCKGAGTSLKEAYAPIWQEDKAQKSLKNTTSLRRPVWLPQSSRVGSIKIALEESGIFLPRPVFGRWRAGATEQLMHAGLQRLPRQNRSQTTIQRLEVSA